MTIPDNYGSVAFKFVITSTGEEVLTTVGFHNTPIDDAQTIADTLAAIWDNDMTGALLSDAYTFTEAYVIISIGGVLQSAESAINSVGTRAEGPPSPAVAVGIKKTTSYAGKHYRGRMYLPAGYMREDHVSLAGVINNTDVTNLQTAIDNVKADMNAGGYPMYLLHSDATVPTPINGLIVRDVVRTQRRRQKLS